MLNGAGLSKEFWVVVVDIACYLKNRSPTSMLVDKTPHEVWFGKKPSIAHLRVFGCDVFMYVQKEKRSRLDNKVEKCIFIGYKDGVKGYKLWNPVTRKIMYNRDVVFKKVENTSKNENESKEKGPEMIHRRRKSHQN